MSDQDLEVGDRIELTAGPFVATWEVVTIKDAGAVLAYLGDVQFVGYEHLMTAPNGDVLTNDHGHAFLGRAHFAGAKRVSP